MFWGPDATETSSVERGPVIRSTKYIVFKGISEKSSSVGTDKGVGQDSLPLKASHTECRSIRGRCELPPAPTKAGA